MKLISIDIDKTPSAKALAEEFKDRNLQRGDQLQLLSSKLPEADFLRALVAIMVFIAIDITLNKKKKTNYVNKIIKDSLNKDLNELESDLKNEYDIQLTFDTKDTDENNRWKDFCTDQLANAYGIDEPEYDISMIKEFNPDYKDESR